ncbi:MAG TPA: hypothetical protein VFW68_04970 [Rhodocyclaceae bacterium]|nr:hypothetical protein [Rhodocyclaceae bacterium]
MSLPTPHPTGAARLTLLIPGLLWPNPALQDTVFDLHLPALQTLLGWSRLSRRSPCDEPGWWRDLAGTDLPAAPLRLLGLGEKADSTWLCADPVHLRFEQSTMVLEDPAKLALDAAESAALYATLAPLIAEFGTLHATTPNQWHLQPKDDAPPCPALLSDLIGQPAKDLLPAGDAYRPWRRLFNEVQMALHDHPVNQAREAAKKPVINSLALWGAGALPAAPAQAAPFDTVLSDDEVHHGIARLLGAQAAALPERFTGAQGRTLAACPQLLVPTRLRDAIRWREGLQILEDAWFAPALAALNQGQLRELTLIGLGDGTCLEARSTALDKLKFWRRPRPLTELHP